MLNDRLNFKQLKRFLPLTQPCLLCKNFDGGKLGICAECFNDLTWHTAPHCPQCGLESGSDICGQCLKNSPDFDRTLALFTYDYPANALLQHFKYHKAHHLAHTFGNLLAEEIGKKSNQSTLVDLVIPMPMHPTRLKERGFNQALEIARIASKKLDLTMDIESCYRKRLTPPQASLPLKERVKNMQDVLPATKICKATLSLLWMM